MKSSYYLKLTLLSSYFGVQGYTIGYYTWQLGIIPYIVGTFISCTITGYTGKWVATSGWLEK